MWVYQEGFSIESGKPVGQWQVGFYAPSIVSIENTLMAHEWKTIITFPLDNEAGAQRMVHFLNGGD